MGDYMRGGKRDGAGRKNTEPTKQMRVPVSMEQAVLSLKRIASKNNDLSDLAELMLIINLAIAGDEKYGERVYGSQIMDAAIKDLERKFDTDFMNQELEQKLDSLRKRVRKFYECGKI